MPDETGGSMIDAVSRQSLMLSGTLLFGVLCFAGGLLAGRHFVGSAPSVVGPDRRALLAAVAIAEPLDPASPTRAMAKQRPLPANDPEISAVAAPVSPPAPVAAAVAVTVVADLQIGVPADQPPELQLRAPLGAGVQALRVRRTFAVRVGAYLEPMIAQRRAAVLQRRGYHPLILSSRQAAEALTWYSVVLGRDDDLTAARQQAEAFERDDHELRPEIVSWRLLQPTRRLGGAPAAPPKPPAITGAEARTAGIADPWRAMATTMRTPRLAAMPAGANLFRPADRDQLDRIAFAVDALESRHGADAAMWRPAVDGPQGPMQVTAAAALDVGGGDRFDLQQNRILGRAYLAQMFSRYGNWRDALAAYNWGPANVDRWIAGGRDPERLPLEVAWYIARVLRNAMITIAVR